MGLASWLWERVCAVRDAVYFFLVGKPFPGSSQEKRAAAQAGGAGAKGGAGSRPAGGTGAGHVMNKGMYASGRPEPGTVKPGPPPVDVRRLNFIQQTSLFSYGQPCVIEYFGTHCPACRRAAPGVAVLARENPQAYVVSVSGDPEDQIRAMMQDIPAMQACNVARDNGDVQREAQRYGVRTIPHAFVYGPDGGLVWEGHPDSGLGEALARAIAMMPPKRPYWEQWEGSGRTL